MEDAYNTTPLAVKVLHKSQDDDSATSDDYEVLQSVVSPSPIPGQEEAEIRTVVERFVDNNHRVLWRRVVVRSGPSCPKQAVHASYMLPDDGKHFASVSMVCWTSFPERPHHKMLCVLASPTLLRIWDVYPDGKVAGIGAEGHSIPLPFEACGIYSLGGSNGLLLQRTETMEDRIAFDAQNKTWTSTGLNVDDDEDGFVLKAPPRPVRLRDSIGTSVGSLNLASSNSVPSLFSLSHPLDDVLPIYNLIEGDLQPGAVSDVFEKIIYVGVLKWTDPDADYAERVTRTQPICVTYHTHRKRYSIVFSLFCYVLLPCTCWLLSHFSYFRRQTRDLGNQKVSAASTAGPVVADEQPQEITQFMEQPPWHPPARSRGYRTFWRCRSRIFAV